jgi:hypothetical protein
VVQPDIVELIERNVNYHKTVYMIDGAVHEIEKHDFQELELAMRNLTIGSCWVKGIKIVVVPRSRE